jgi:pimeloyl-ACP methyl ester carboxylesterase
METGKGLCPHGAARVLLVVFWAIRFLFAINCQAQAPSGSQYIRRADKESVVVFVHGVLGDSRSTWTNASTKVYWPDLMKGDPYFRDFDIFVIEYPSSVFRPSYTVDELVEVLRRELDSAGVFAKHRRVYFVCHSMGGLVVRGYLARYRNRVPQVPMIYFFSTPTTGAEIASLASLLSRNRQMRSMLPIDANEYLASVQKDWLAAQFPIASYCGYETQDTDGIRVVGESSASNLCNRRLDPIAANHLDIVKPRDTKDAPYISVRNALQEVRPDPASVSEGSKQPSKSNRASQPRAVPTAAPSERPTNSIIENAGKMDGVNVSGAEVTAPPGGKGTVINNLPGGDASNIKIDNAKVSGGETDSSQGNPMVGFKNSRNSSFDNNVICNSRAIVIAEGNNSDLAAKNNKLNEPSLCKPVTAITPSVPTPQQDNSVHIGEGAQVEQTSKGPCSPNIIGGSNTVNCSTALLAAKVKSVLYQEANRIAPIEHPERPGPRQLFSSLFQIQITEASVPMLTATVSHHAMVRIGCTRLRPGTLWSSGDGYNTPNGNGVCKFDNAFGIDTVMVSIVTIDRINPDDVKITWVCEGVRCE